MNLHVLLKGACLVLAIGLGMGSVVAACHGEVIVPGSTTGGEGSYEGEGAWEGIWEGEGAFEGVWEGEGAFEGVWEGEGGWEGEGAPEPIFDAGTSTVDAG
ncbi:MAG: hypothetical protein QM820_08670 [Minicystis sp.]